VNLDTFLISLIFDDKQTKSSANKIDGIVKNLTRSIQSGLSTIGTFDFLKGAVDNFKNLSTEVDNLNYVTGESTTAILTFSEAVKRNGGTMQGAIGFLGDFSKKMRDVLFSTNAGQLAPFLKAGLSISDITSGNMDKVLSNLSTTFARLNGNRALQLRLGEMLGIDPTIIRTLSLGNEKLAELRNRMQELGLTNEINVKTGIQFRDAMYNVNLVIEAMKNKLAQLLIPFLNKFADIATKVINFFNHNGYLMQTILIVIASALTAYLIPSFIKLISLFNPFKPFALVLAGIVLVLQDFIVWLNGGNSALGKFYTWLFGSREQAKAWLETLKSHLPTILKWVAGIYTAIAAFKVLRVVILALDAVSLLNPIGLAIAAITAALVAGYYAWEKWGGAIKRALSSFKNKIFGNSGGTPNPQPTHGSATIPSIASFASSTSKSANAAIVAGIAKSLGFDAGTALAIANIESGLNPNALAGGGSSAAGTFQLIDSTAAAYGLSKADKLNPTLNATAGIKNLKSTASALSKFLGRKPTGGELYLGEMLGLGGAERVLSAGSNTQLSSLLSAKAISGNNFAGMTAGQLRARAENVYNNSSKAVSVNVGNLNVHSPSANPVEVGKQVAHQLSVHANIVNNYENGRKA
jgi:hypothetical protein